MKKITALLKSLWAFKSAKVVIIAMAAILVFNISSHIFRGCYEREDRELSELQGRFEAYQKEKKAEEKEQKKIILAKQGEIKELNDAIGEKDKLITDLQKNDYEIVPVEVHDEPEAGENWEEVAKRNAESSRAWKEKYWKSQDVIRELGPPTIEGYDPETHEPIYYYPEGSITWTINQKYLKQVDITAAVQAQLDRANNLLEISKDLNIKKDKKITRMKLKFTLASIGRESLIFAAGYFLGSKT